MTVYWPAVIMLFYILCGLGFTMKGILALSAWSKGRRRRKGA
jgi:hypothetical protein